MRLPLGAVALDAVRQRLLGALEIAVGIVREPEVRLRRDEHALVLLLGGVVEQPVARLLHLRRDCSRRGGR